MAYKNITAQKILELDFYHDNSTAYNLLETYPCFDMINRVPLL